MNNTSVFCFRISVELGSHVYIAMFGIISSKERLSFVDWHMCFFCLSLGVISAFSNI